MIALIVAYAKNQVIGNKGCIPWKIKGEQKRFRELTTGNVVIMGRRSYEEIGKPLPNRTTIVISRTKKFEGENCYTADSLSAAIELAGDKDIYISGGARLYEEALPLVERMYITEIDKDFEGDVSFPEINLNEWKVTEREQGPEEGENTFNYEYVTYEKI